MFEVSDGIGALILWSTFLYDLIVHRALVSTGSYIGYKRELFTQLLCISRSAVKGGLPIKKWKKPCLTKKNGDTSLMHKVMCFCLEMIKNICFY